MTPTAQLSSDEPNESNGMSVFTVDDIDVEVLSTMGVSLENIGKVDYSSFENSVLTMAEMNAALAEMNEFDKAHFSGSNRYGRVKQDLDLTQGKSAEDRCFDLKKRRRKLRQLRRKQK